MTVAGTIPASTSGAVASVSAVTWNATGPMASSRGVMATVAEGRSR